MPALTSASTNASAHNGVCSEGFSTIPFPASKAGKHFHDGIATGKFHGRDHPDDADRLARRPCHLVDELGRDDTAERAPALTGDEAAHVDGLLHIAARLDEDLSRLASDERGELALSLGDHLRGPGDQIGTSRDRSPRPLPLRRRSPTATARSTSAAVADVNVPSTSAGPGGVDGIEGGHHLIVSVFAVSSCPRASP